MSYVPVMACFTECEPFLVVFLSSFCPACAQGICWGEQEQTDERGFFSPADVMCAL